MLLNDLPNCVIAEYILKHGTDIAHVKLVVSLSRSCLHKDDPIARVQIKLGERDHATIFSH